MFRDNVGPKEFARDARYEQARKDGKVPRAEITIRILDSDGNELAGAVETVLLDHAVGSTASASYCFPAINTMFADGGKLAKAIDKYWKKITK